MNDNNKNKDLFKAIGEIPEEYVEDALNDRVVREKKINWKSIASVAAVAAAVAAVPVSIGIGQNRTGSQNENINPALTDVSSSITEEADSNENTDSEDISESAGEETVHQLGTGKSRPENYTPDRKYSFAELPEDEYANEYYYSADEFFGYLINIICDKDYAYEIAEDTAKSAEKLLNDIKSQSAAETESVFCKYRVNEIINGYMAVDIYVYYGSCEVGSTVVYDIIEERKLDNYSDLFYAGTDYISLFEKALNYKEPDKNSYADSMYNISGGFTYVNYSDTYYNENNTAAGFWRKNVRFKKFNEYDNENHSECGILDYMISSEYRDVSEYVSGSSDREWDEWYCGYKTENISGNEIPVFEECSRFYSDNEITEHNSDIIEIYSLLYSKLASENRLTDEILARGLRFSKPYEFLLDNLQVYYIDNNEEEAVYFDTIGHREVTADDIFGDWKKYITGYFTVNSNSDDYERIVTEPKDLTEYALVDWYWNNSYYVSQSDIEKNGYEQSEEYGFNAVSEDEIDSLPDVAFYFVLRNRNTNEEITVRSVIPVENLGYFFNRDEYTRQVRQWDR